MEEHLFEKWLTPCKVQIVLGSGNILLIKIKIKCLTGQNLEIMTFRYNKTLLFDKLFKNLEHYLMFLFLKSIISDNTNLLFMFIQICPPHIHLSPIHFRKIDTTTKNSGGFIRYPHCSGGMMPWASFIFLTIFSVVSQGSFLGPLFFLICIKNLSNGTVRIPC